MGVSGSQVQGQGLERATVFLNPGDPEIFQVSPFALATELTFSPKTTNVDSNLFNAELLISIFNNYKYLTQEKNEKDLFLHILIPSMIRSRQCLDNSIAIPKQLFHFQNERLNFFCEKFISALRVQTKIPETGREIPELQQRFSYNISVNNNMIEKIVDPKSLSSFVKTMITSDVVLNFATLPDNRKKRGIKTQIEMQTTQNYAPNFDTLNVEDKLVAFRKGLMSTDGLDIKRILLSNAPNTAYWLERRTTYSSSMAMTSIAGYILGLGDRHLSNIMMGKGSAKLVHIDFGDCFEVAMHRDRYPETVPFRLTRLLVNAFEVSRIEGTFRSCCENTLELMRNNGEQILGLLEAFIYDPLLQWTTNTVRSEKKVKSENPVSIVKRISDKLSGSDFEGKNALSVHDQVDQLIIQATDERNLCQMFSGWFPWW